MGLFGRKKPEPERPTAFAAVLVWDVDARDHSVLPTAAAEVLQAIWAASQEANPGEFLGRFGSLPEEGSLKSWPLDGGGVVRAGVMLTDELLAHSNARAGYAFVLLNVPPTSALTAEGIHARIGQSLQGVQTGGLGLEVLKLQQS